MDDFATRTRPRATFQQFAAFRDERPKEEKWELIDGRLTMMPPPALLHQRIAGNLDRLLVARLEVARPDWTADREIGVHVPEDEHWCPEPDVTVIDVAFQLGQIYAERFYMVAEVLSPNDKLWALDLKRDYYRAHVHCLAILFVQQTRIALELHVRTDAGWRRTDLTEPAAVIDLPEVGGIGTLGDLYRQTPLAVAR